MFFGRASSTELQDLILQSFLSTVLPTLAHCIKRSNVTAARKQYWVCLAVLQFKSSQNEGSGASVATNFELANSRAGRI